MKSLAVTLEHELIKGRSRENLELNHIPGREDRREIDRARAAPCASTLENVTLSSVLSPTTASERSIVPFEPVTLPNVEIEPLSPARYADGLAPESTNLQGHGLPSPDSQQ